MIPPDDAESPNALDDDDDDDPVDPVDPSPSTLDTNAFLVRLVLVPNASASPLPAPSASNSALGADVVRALAPRTARATCAPLHRAACRSSLRAIARVAYMFTTNATNAMTNAMRCDAMRRDALGRDVSRAARDSRSARRDRGPIDSRRARSSRARVDARHRVTTRPRRSTSSVGDARRRGRSHSRARHRPTDATRARGGVMTTPARGASRARVDAAPGRPARVPSRRRSFGRRTRERPECTARTRDGGDVGVRKSDDDDDDDDGRARARRTRCGCC